MLDYNSVQRPNILMFHYYENRVGETKREPLLTQLTGIFPACPLTAVFLCPKHTLASRS